MQQLLRLAGWLYLASLPNSCQRRVRTDPSLNAQAAALLAFIDESGRHEAEYVIDPAYLSDDVVHLHE